MTVTGYADTFGRTVSNGLGSATSGQAYTLVGVASQFSVAPNVASIAIASAGDKIGYVDRQTSDIDITAQVALSAIPATNLATVGIASKLSNSSNYYVGSMMVATGGAISLRLSKVVGGSLVTLATVATGLTYVANTFYNLHYQCFWSNLLQTNVMSLKLWTLAGTEPGGWMATTTDAAITQFTAGTNAGLHTRDESSVVGSITAKIQNVVAKTYALPMPAPTDTMCADPAVAYPKQTAVQSLAAATDAVMATFDPLASLAGLFPRVRVSVTNLQIINQIFFAPTFNATEFNVGTPTNIGYNNSALFLPIGIWLVTFEIRLAEAASNSLLIQMVGGQSFSQPATYMRSNATQLNDDGVGGCSHISALTYCTDPVTPNQYSIQIFPTNTATTYTIAYAALSAVKISDYYL